MKHESTKSKTLEKVLKELNVVSKKLVEMASAGNYGDDFIKLVHRQKELSYQQLQLIKKSYVKEPVSISNEAIKKCSNCSFRFECSQAFRTDSSYFKYCLSTKSSFSGVKISNGTLLEIPESIVDWKLRLIKFNLVHEN